MMKAQSHPRLAEQGEPRTHHQRGLGWGMLQLARAPGSD